MKRMVMEMWVTDEAAKEMVAEMPADLDEMVDEEKVLGVRLTFPDGNVIRAGQTFG